MTATTPDRAFSSLLQTETDAVPYELRIGVTGHREIDDPVAIRGAVRSLVKRIASMLGHSELVPIRWTIVSPLASGADQIVADVLTGEFGAALEVITPFELDEYRKDFQGADREEFERLLKIAKHVHQLEGPSGEERNSDDVIDAESRKLAYRRLGEQVVDTSEIVLTVWNGEPAAGRGGTEEIVHYAIEHQRLVLWVHRDHPTDEAQVVLAIHRHGHAMKIKSSALRTAAGQISRGHSQQLAYQADDGIANDVIAYEIDEMTKNLEAIAAQCGLSAADLQPLTTLVPHYVRADLLARSYQRRHVRATNWVMALAGSGVTIAVVQAILFGHDAWLISFEIIGMAAAWLWWQWGRRARWHEKWLQDRFLAERLRLTMFSALVDVPPGVFDHGLPFYPGPQNWLRGVADELAHRAIALRTGAAPTAVKNLLLRAWLRDQHDHHAKNAERVHRRAHRRHQIGGVLFGATLIMAILHLVPPVGHGPAGPMITVFALILPVWAGGIHAVTTQLELDRVAERSRRMTQLLADSIVNMAAAETPGDVKRTVREAARMMARETHEWWVLLSFQNVQLHV